MGKLAKKEDGIIILNGSVVGITKQCVHCGNHFLSVKGSGKKRGWCMKCHGITCGKIECCKCVPFEKKLEIMENLNR